MHHSTTGTISTNPTDYQWTQVVGGFGTTKALFYTTAGGGQIYFSANTTPPSLNYQPVADDTPIQLQQLANSIVTTNSIIPGAITTNLLAANLVVARDIVSTNATLGNYASPGYWLQANTGSARLGGNVNIGGNITIGSNAVIGGNLTIGNNAVIGGNLTVAGLITSANLNANTVQTTTMQLNSVTTTSALNANGTTVTNPTFSYGGFDGSYYYYNTLTAGGLSGIVVSATTANVVNIVSGYIDVSG